MFILKGYAGTGKSTLIASIVQHLLLDKNKFRLLAPTGKAAKVISNYSKQAAFTIHKQIYFVGGEFNAGTSLVKAKNLYKDTLFIVDEASMVGVEDANSSNSLLADLMNYVYSGVGCRLMLVGDPGQLPPVGQTDSPALDLDYLKNLYPQVQLFHSELKEIVRQAADSQITQVATELRNTSAFNLPLFSFFGTDVQRIGGADLSELLEQSYAKHGMDECVLLTMSNKRANQWNGEIRSRILGHEENVAKEDILMVVKNNYFWLQPESLIGFIANGETIRINRIGRREKLYGFEFVTAEISFVDYPDEKPMELILNLEALTVEAPSLSRDRLKTLFFEIEKDYYQEKNKKKR